MSIFAANAHFHNICYIYLAIYRYIYSNFSRCPKRMEKNNRFYVQIFGNGLWVSEIKFKSILPRECKQAQFRFEFSVVFVVVFSLPFFLNCPFLLLVRYRNGHSSDVIKQQFDSFFALHLWIIKTLCTNPVNSRVMCLQETHRKYKFSKCIKAFCWHFPYCIFRVSVHAQSTMLNIYIHTYMYKCYVWFEFWKFAYDLFMKCLCMRMCIEFRKT